MVTGLMGAGKTTLAHGLGQALGRPVRDSDGDIEALFGVTGRAIAATDGVDALHRLEEAVLLGALAESTPTIIAAAAWVVEDEWCRRALARRAWVVVLDADVDRLLDRFAPDDHRRAMERTELAALADRRRPLFETVADLILDGGTEPAVVLALALDGYRSQLAT